jgi:hypothetical protein
MHGGCCGWRRRSEASHQATDRQDPAHRRPCILDWRGALNTSVQFVYSFSHLCRFETTYI